MRTLAEAATVGGRVVVGVSTDQLDASAPTLDQIIDAYREQIDAVESAGGDVVMMASRHLARTATSVDDYRTVYDAVLGDATRPVILHWLGAAFDPQLSGYWGFDEPKAAMPTVASLIADHGNKVRGSRSHFWTPR